MKILTLKYEIVFPPRPRTPSQVSLMSELGRLVDENCLMDVSQLEQDMACTNDHAGHLQQLTEKIQDPDVEDADAIRLALLYALRYEPGVSMRAHACLSVPMRAQACPCVSMRAQACPCVPIICVYALKGVYGD